MLCRFDEQTLAYLRHMYIELHVTLQPVELGVPGTSLVVYNDYRLKVKSLVKALDLCFKLIQVLHCSTIN